jgi:hypothetical protein
MKSKSIESLLLNIGDELNISLIDYYYKLSQKGKQKIVEMSWNKKGQEGWIACPKITGSYCGDTYRQKPYEISIIKIRVSSPFTMGKSYRSYFEFSPHAIQSITVVRKAKETILSKIHHALIED